MTNLLNFFFEETTTPTDGGYGTWIIFGVLIVAVIAMTIIPRRKNKKAQEEMKAKLVLGCEVTTIGGIVGALVELSDTHFVIETGAEGSKTTMKFVRQAIHSVAPSATSAEGMQIAKEQARADEEIDEIK